MENMLSMILLTLDTRIRLDVVFAGYCKKRPYGLVALCLLSLLLL